MKKETSAGFIVYTYNKTTHEPLYLVMQTLSSCWDLPKGKLEAGETSLQAAIRELHEETGQTVVVQQGFEHELTYTFRNRSGEPVDKKVIFFIGLSASPTVTLSREHKAYKWLTYDQAHAQLTYENARELLVLAHARITSVQK